VKFVAGPKLNGESADEVEPATTPQIFISYRREDSIAYAGRIYDHFASHFGKDNIFMDIDTLQPGVDFVDVLQDAVGACDVLLAVIGKDWLTLKDEQGNLRISNPEDWVRLEIAAALERDIRVVPVLVGGARSPRASDLPEQISRLAHANLTNSPIAVFSPRSHT
jgi:hypothetical protein